MAKTFRDLLQQIDAQSASAAEKGKQFEQLTKAFLEQEKSNLARFKKVWLWNEWPNRGKQTDIGIDLVAETHDDKLIAIQCKFISPTKGRIDYDQVTHFLTAINDKRWDFAEGIFVSTCDNWTEKAENALKNNPIPVSRWSCEIFENSSIDWDKAFRMNHFESKEKPQFTSQLKEELAKYKTSPKLPQRPIKTLRPYQETALNAVLKGFSQTDRGKLIMACGSGKTLVALRIAESFAPNGAILFLTPSISLLAQSLMDWDADAQSPLRIFAVCSDLSADQRQNENDPLHMPLLEIKIPPTTSPQKLANAFHKNQNNKPNAKGLTVIFCTYQSLEVIHQAQQNKQNPLPQLDLIVCDEAHRTTGQSDTTSNKTEQKGFQRIHDSQFICARKRLYMTATPRIYGDRAQRKAAAKQILLASMDDEKLFGKNFHKLGFGTAIDENILCGYKVIIQEVDMEQASRYLDAELRKTDKSGINLDNGARMIGCWNALRKHGKPEVFDENEPPARRAVAFSNRIAQSKLFQKHFPTVIKECQKHQENDSGQPLQCETKHVDGTQLSRERADSLQWLRQEPADGQCKILSNARCLTEGIDVPALDAVLFLQPRESEIDVVQAVGRVMRKAKGKQRGYIIIPIAVPKGVSGRQALESGVYKTVWQVLNAVKAHDDRFAAKINQLALAQKDYLQQKDIGQENSQQSPADEIADALKDQLEFSSINPALKNFVLAKIVHSVSDPKYWTKWIDATHDIVQRTHARIQALRQRPETQPFFDRFFASIKTHIQGMPIQDAAAIELLALHQVSRPVFESLFGKQSSPLAQTLETILDELDKYGLAEEMTALQPFFRDVKLRVKDVRKASAKSQILLHFYESFFHRAMPRETQSFGIAYTPIEAVDYILHAVNAILKRNWNKTLGSAGVHIIEPFAGTGTFLARLIDDPAFIADEELERKYQSEIFANEIMPLAYFAAQANISHSYRQRCEQSQNPKLKATALPFHGLWFGDTFRAYETQTGNQPDFAMPGLEENYKILNRQKQASIKVILGNPPWSAGQKHTSHDNKNLEHPKVEKRIQETYVKETKTHIKRALYDYYVKAIRWASDRLGDPMDQKNRNTVGIIGFITNNGWIEGKSLDGLRKCLLQEFDEVLVFNLKGNARNFAGAKQEGQTFFDGTMAGCAILILVRFPDYARGVDGVLLYRDVGDGLKRDEKKAELRNASKYAPNGDVLKASQFQIIQPDAKSDWLGQTDPAFQQMIPLYGKEQNRVFLTNSFGCATRRDWWVYDYDETKLSERIQRMMEFFNHQPKDKEKFDGDDEYFNWSTNAKNMLRRGFQMVHDPSKIVTAVFRPFEKTHFYYCPSVIHSGYLQHKLFPHGAENQAVCVSHHDSIFACLMSDCVPDGSFASTHTQTLPRWVYAPSPRANSDIAACNINPRSILAFSRAIKEDDGMRSRAELEQAVEREVDADGVFYYVYGFLHREDWRKKWEGTLRKESARIELPRSLEEFRRVSQAGKELAELHLTYETIEPYPLEIEKHADFDDSNPAHWEVEKMKYGGKRPNIDKTVIHYNRLLTIRGIPLEVQEYKLGHRSALDWVLARYRVKTDRRSGIARNPNSWGGGKYIWELIPRIVRLSLKTRELQKLLASNPAAIKTPSH